MEGCDTMRWCGWDPLYNVEYELELWGFWTFKGARKCNVQHGYLKSDWLLEKRTFSSQILGETISFFFPLAFPHLPVNLLNWSEYAVCKYMFSHSMNRHLGDIVEQRIFVKVTTDKVQEKGKKKKKKCVDNFLKCTYRSHLMCFCLFFYGDDDFIQKTILPVLLLSASCW